MISKFVLCFLASLFFAVTLNAPKRSILISSAIASAGYVVYSYLSGLSLELPGYFAATIIMAALCEAASRIFKMPTAVFITPAVIPIVPGIGIYQMILYLVYGKHSLSFWTGVDAMIAIGTMAMAIALVTFTVKIITASGRRKRL